MDLILNDFDDFESPKIDQSMSSKVILKRPLKGQTLKTSDIPDILSSTKELTIADLKRIVKADVSFT